MKTSPGDSSLKKRVVVHNADEGSSKKAATASRITSKPIYSGPTIQLIKAKYGNVEKDSDLKSEVMRQVVLGGICILLRELRNLKIDELNVHSLEKYYDAADDAEYLKIDVKWFRRHLDRIKEAINLNFQTKGLIAERDALNMKLIKQQEDLEAINIRKENVEKEIVSTSAMIESLNGDITRGTNKFGSFKCSCLLDGLF